jgi:hypothetical protein
MEKLGIEVREKAGGKEGGTFSERAAVMRCSMVGDGSVCSGNVASGPSGVLGR